MLMVSIYMYVCGAISFCLVRKYLLSLLLSLEFIVLSLYFLLVNYLVMFDYEVFFLMIFLTFSVCEGALGLGLLVSMVRSFGNSFFQVFSVLW